MHGFQNSDQTALLIQSILLKKKTREKVNSFFGFFILIIIVLTLFYGRKIALNFKNDTSKNIISPKSRLYKISDKFIKSGSEKIEIIGNEVIDKKYIQSLIANKSSIADMFDEIEKVEIFEDIFVRRVIPNRINISLKEKTIIGFVKYKDFDDVYLIDKNGNVIFNQSLNTLYEGLPLIEDVEDVSVFMSLYAFLDYNFVKTHIKTFKILGNRRVDITLKNNIVLKFPKDNIKAAVSAVDYLIKNFNIFAEDTDIKYIDLRLSEKVYIGYK